MANKRNQNRAGTGSNWSIFTGDFKFENIAFVSGQLPIDPATGEFAGNDIASQTRQSLKNVQAILAENGMTMADVTKTTVLLADIAEFAEMNQVYAEFLQEPFPARAAFEVAAFTKMRKVEIEAIAVKR